MREDKSYVSFENVIIRLKRSIYYNIYNVYGTLIYIIYKLLCVRQCTVAFFFIRELESIGLFQFPRNDYNRRVRGKQFLFLTCHSMPPARDKTK